MSLKPTANNVLLEPQQFQPSQSLHIVVPQKYTPDPSIYRVVSCGNRVPSDIQPGCLIVMDRYTQNPDEMTVAGRRLMVTSWKNIAAVLGVPAE